MVEDFIPEGVMMSNRAYYLILLKASCEYLINYKSPGEKQSVPEMGDQVKQKEDKQTDIVEEEECKDETPVVEEYYEPDACKNALNDETPSKQLAPSMRRTMSIVVKSTK